MRLGTLRISGNCAYFLLWRALHRRKAWIFRGTFGGARRGCVLWSLTMSCRLHGLDPRRYLLDTLEALRTTSHGGLGALTPRAYAERMKALANAA